jgi:hypothetical protein
MDKRIKAKSLVGKIFGKLTVVSRAPNTPKSPQWNCVCTCGNKVVVPTQRLIKGTSKSCGCLREVDNAAFTLLFRTYKLNARKKDLEFKLTEEQFRNITSSNCYYTGRKPTKTLTTVSGDIYKYNGIDRLDNTQGYVLHNCVPCCTEINYAKRTLPFKQFIALCAEVTKQHKQL